MESHEVQPQLPPQTPQLPPPDIQAAKKNANRNMYGTLIFVICVIVLCLLIWAGIEIKKLIDKSKESKELEKEKES
jgi:Na+-transporting NADH:ubiquinone oxidoreductase subunit NqrC